MKKKDRINNKLISITPPSIKLSNKIFPVAKVLNKLLDANAKDKQKLIEMIEDTLNDYIKLREELYKETLNDKYVKKKYLELKERLNKRIIKLNENKTDEDNDKKEKDNHCDASFQTDNGFNVFKFDLTFINNQKLNVYFGIYCNLDVKSLYGFNENNLKIENFIDSILKFGSKSTHFDVNHNKVTINDREAVYISSTKCGQVIHFNMITGLTYYEKELLEFVCHLPLGIKNLPSSTRYPKRYILNKKDPQYHMNLGLSIIYKFGYLKFKSSLNRFETLLSASPNIIDKSLPNSLTNLPSNTIDKSLYIKNLLLEAQIRNLKMHLKLKDDVINQLKCRINNKEDNLKRNIQVNFNFLYLNYTLKHLFSN